MATNKRSKKGKEERNHQMVAMVVPPSRLEQRISPFTELVIAMPADAGKALVYDLQPGEAQARGTALCGSAIRAAKRRDPKKMFEVRHVNHRGVETCAIWRIR